MPNPNPNPKPYTVSINRVFGSFLTDFDVHRRRFARLCALYGQS